MTGRFRVVQGVAVPTFIYGTAWKEDETSSLVTRALAAGFRGIDTANQARHYREEGVGRALARAFEGDGPGRKDLFIQTKFTFPAGQDHRVPYDVRATVSEQVEQSFHGSLAHLGVETIDSYVLHGPSRPRGLGAPDRSAWRAMELLQEAGRVRLLGVSNFRPDQLNELCEFARRKVAFIQNRCFARTGWDAAVRGVCEERGVVYQAFSLLTANPGVLAHPVLAEIAARHGCTRPQLVFRFALELGMIPLTGTTDARHMEEDLGIYGFALDGDDVRAIEGLRSGG